MAKDDIKKFVKESEDKLDQEYNDNVKSIKDDLASFKKKTLSKI